MTTAWFHERGDIRRQAIWAVLTSAAFYLAGCNSLPIDSYKNNTPKNHWSTSEIDAAFHGIPNPQVNVAEVMAPHFVERATISAVSSVFRNMDSAKDITARPLYVGVAISGGGSRAANFGAASLMELDRLGLLNHTKAISSVSGGSIAAAYYGLHAKSGELDWNEFRNKLGLDLRAEGIHSLLRPDNLVKLLFTNKDRSDLMAEVLDRHFFYGRSFGDLAESGPRILINATEITGGIKPFVFSTEYFWRWGSSLRDYPLSSAVMASAAFPGLLDNVTLRDFQCRPFERTIINRAELRRKLMHNDGAVERHLRSFLSESDLQNLKDRDDELEKLLNRFACATPGLYDEDAFKTVPLRSETALALKQRNLQTFGLSNRQLLEDAFPEHLPALPPTYRHLLDGGAADNLGIETLEKSLASDPAKYDACLLVIVDAYTGYARPRTASLEPDTRRFFDYLVNSNAVHAFDALLDSRRDIQLRERQISSNFDLPALAWRDVGKHRCLIWRVGFDRLYAREKNLPSLVSGELNRPGSILGDFVPAMLYTRSVQLAAESADTDLRLISTRGCPARAVQAALWDAARFLISEDVKTLRYIFSELKLEELGIDTTPIDEPRVTFHKLAMESHPDACLAGRSTDARQIVVTNPPRYIGRIPYGYTIPSTKAQITPLDTDEFNPFARFSPF